MTSRTPYHRNEGFVGLCWWLKQFSWTFFLCKHLLLLQKMLIAAGHVSENSLRHILTDSTGISAKGRGGGYHFPSSHTWLRPCLHVSVFVWERNFFSPFSKKFASTRSVFESFSPVHTYTTNQFENDNLPNCASLTHTCTLIMSPRKLRFQMKTDTCGQGLSWRHSESVVYRLTF